MNRALALRSPSAVVPGPLVAAAVVVFTEIMFFAALISAYLVARSYAGIWPPPDQPRLPVALTGANTALLLLSGILLWRSFPSRAGSRRLHLAAVAAGLVFVLVQGAEWARLIGHGLTLTSGSYGSFFYLLIGAHGAHVLAGAAILAAFVPGKAGGPRAVSGDAARRAAALYWYFVVGLWPVLYGLVYLA